MSNLLENPQKHIAKLFGYNEDFARLMTTMPAKTVALYDNTEHDCMMCGSRHTKGALTVEHLSDRYNNCYSFADTSSPFVCEYCLYNALNYDVKDKKEADGITPARFSRMGNIIITDDCIEPFTKDDLFAYVIRQKEYKLPFVAMLASMQGTFAISDSAHTVAPTVDDDLLVVNYGNEVHRVSRYGVVECMKEVSKLLERYNSGEFRREKIKLTSEVLFNWTRSKNYNEYFTMKLRNLEPFRNDLEAFLTRYNTSMRFIAGMLYKRYIEQENKETTQDGTI